MLCDKEWSQMIFKGRLQSPIRAFNHRQAVDQSPRATEVAPTVCRAAAKGTAIKPAVPLPFDKFINGRVNSDAIHGPGVILAWSAE